MKRIALILSMICCILFGVKSEAAQQIVTDELIFEIPDTFVFWNTDENGLNNYGVYQGEELRGYFDYFVLTEETAQAWADDLSAKLDSGAYESIGGSTETSQNGIEISTAEVRIAEENMLYVLAMAEGEHSILVLESKFLYDYVPFGCLVDFINTQKSIMPAAAREIPGIDNSAQPQETEITLEYIIAYGKLLKDIYDTGKAIKDGRKADAAIEYAQCLDDLEIISRYEGVQREGDTSYAELANQVRNLAILIGIFEGPAEETTGE